MSKQLIATVIVSLGVGLGGGYLASDLLAENDTNDSAVADHAHEDFATDMSHNGMDHHDDTMTHSHGTFDVEAAEAPTVSFTAVEDAKSGFNISISTENFNFTPEKVNGVNVIGEGHAHLYVDGEKVARLYGPNYHYEGNFDDTKTFRVTLNANNHSEYAVDGEVIAAEQQVTHEAHE